MLVVRTSNPTHATFALNGVRPEKIDEKMFSDSVHYEQNSIQNK